MKLRGKLRSWNDGRGFGFIRLEGSREEFFVHIRSFENLKRRPVDGDLVSFVKAQADDGRYQAIEANIVGHAKFKSKKHWNWVVLVLAMLMGTAIAAKLLGLFAIAVALMNLATFAAYGSDKRAAQSDNGRISEANLFSLGMLGGWPAGLLAQRIFRHKTSKRSFLVWFWLSILLNIVLFAGLGAANWFSNAYGVDAGSSRASEGSMQIPKTRHE